MYLSRLVCFFREQKCSYIAIIEFFRMQVFMAIVNRVIVFGLCRGRLDCWVATHNPENNYPVDFFLINNCQNVVMLV
jgi:hypothetical protein